MKHASALIVLLTMLVFSACTPMSAPTAAPSRTPLPANTLPPTMTATPTPTVTPTVTATPSATATPNKGVQNPGNGHWYLVFPQMNWESAVNDCARKGGHLVTLDDKAENMFIYHLAPQAILGATDRYNEGHWVWATGEKMSYTNWCTGEPNNCGASEIYGKCMPENYLAFHTDARCRPGQWNDVGDGGRYVCEFEN
jgi:hypothetical protein